MAADPTPPPVPEQVPPPEPGPEASIDDIQADIETTREQLGETVEALAAKADISGQAKQKVADTGAALSETAHHAQEVVVEKAHQAQSAARDALTDDTGSVRKTIPIGAVAVALGVVGVLLWRRRR